MKGEKRVKYRTKIPLHQDDIKLIIKSFEDGEFEYFDVFREHPTTTSNGQGSTIWNHIFTQLEHNFTKKGFQVGKIRRGWLWELLYIYHEKSGYLYTFMRCQNYKALLRSSNETFQYHYCRILSRLNGKLLNTYQPEYEQLSIGGFSNINESDCQQLNEMLNEMIGKIDGKVERYALVLVNQSNGVVSDIECVIPIENRASLYRESWKEFIGAQYVTDDYGIEAFESDDSEILLFDREINTDNISLDSKVHIDEAEYNKK